MKAVGFARTWFNRSLGVAGLGMMLGLATPALAAPAQVICVFDPAGTQGDAYSMMKDFKLTAVRWGANIELRAYTCLLYTSPSPRD